MNGLWWIFGAAGVIAMSLALGWRPWRARRRERLLTGARDKFHRQREQLEARFVSAAAGSGKPRGLRWADCQFEDAVLYARDRRSGELSAFVAVTIGFEAVAGGGMEENENVGNLRAGTAVFQFERDHWATQGRAIFNLNPDEALRHYEANLERVG